MAFLASIGSWILKAFLEWLWPKVVGAISSFIDKIKRDKKQNEAKEKVEDDIKEKTPRDDEMKKNEEDWMNS